MKQLQALRTASMVRVASHANMAYAYIKSTGKRPRTSNLGEHRGTGREGF